MKKVALLSILLVGCTQNGEPKPDEWIYNQTIAGVRLGDDTNQALKILERHFGHVKEKRIRSYNENPAYAVSQSWSGSLIVPFPENDLCNSKGKSEKINVVLWRNGNKVSGVSCQFNGQLDVNKFNPFYISTEGLQDYDYIGVFSNLTPNITYREIASFDYCERDVIDPPRINFCKDNKIGPYIYFMSFRNYFSDDRAVILSRLN